ncbi:MAG: hypothetical protein CMJ18_14005 [Phycisphaeraceae bacterium]|nr:hypothetical protein [Phycisphaeraceae bacterium]
MLPSIARAVIGDGTDPAPDFAWEATSLPQSSFFSVEDNPNATWVFPCLDGTCGGSDDIPSFEQVQLDPSTVRMFGFPIAGGPGNRANGSRGTKEILGIGLNDADPGAGDFTNTILGWRHDGGTLDVDADPFTFDISAAVDYGAALAGDFFNPLGFQISSGSPVGVGDRVLEINFMIGAGSFADDIPGAPPADPNRFNRVVIWDGYGPAGNYGAHVIDVAGLDVRDSHVYRITTDNQFKGPTDGAIPGVSSRQVKLYIDDLPDPVFDGFLQTHTNETSNLFVSSRADCLNCYVNADVDFIRAVDGQSLMQAPGITSTPAKQIMMISSGLNAPDTVYLRNNIAELSQRGFDGVATWVAVSQVARVPSGRLRLLDNGFAGSDLGRTVVWRRNNEPWMYEGAVADLQQAHAAGGMDNNFVRVQLGVPPRGVEMDWFDDGWWGRIANNIGIMAGIADDGGAEGLLIDLEPYYGSSVWGYEQLQQSDPATYDNRTFEQVRAMVRQRGREFGQAISAEDPDATLMFFTASSFPALQITLPEFSSIEDAPSGLVVPFLDGILEGTTAETTIVDANSWTKWMTEDSEFAMGAGLVSQSALALSEVPGLYADKVKVGFTFRTSYDPNESFPGDMFESADPNANYFSPAVLEASIEKAIEHGDGYVLFWEGLGNWWLDSPTAVPRDGAPYEELSRWIDPVYWQALANARAHFGSSPSLIAPEPACLLLILPGLLTAGRRGNRSDIRL